MKRTLYIHIGFPKTGSTTLQRVLYRNSDSLKMMGIYYPDPILGPILRGHEGHSSMSEVHSRLLYDATPWHVYRKMYLESLLKNDFPVNILSSENFVCDNPEIFSIFKDKFDIRIICFFRNFFDFQISAKKQIIKEGFRPDVFFTSVQGRNFKLLARVENYVKYFGKENCLFLNYDKAARNKNIVQVFFNAMDIPEEKVDFSVEKINVTPVDAATMFLYQLLFIPFNYGEWALIRNEVLQMDLSKWKAFRSSFLSKDDLRLDEYSRNAIKRQGELLGDDGWYDNTVKRGDELESLPVCDLSVEIQHDIFDKLSEKARKTLMHHWPKAASAKSTDRILPSMERLSSESFDLLVPLRRNRVVLLGKNIQLEESLRKNDIESKKNEQKRIIEHEEKNKALALKKESERARERARAKSLMLSSRTLRPRLSSCLAPLLSASARHAYVIRQSGLFDVCWYLDQYPDVADAGVDPVLHYVRCGAKEGRDPAPWFSTSAYLQANPDVAASGVNPFYHYIRYGFVEGRKSFSCC